MLPTMKNQIKIEDKTMKRFKGINVCEDYASGDICEELNMSSRMYPSICTRIPRKITQAFGKKITGTGNYEGIIYTYVDSSEKVFLNCNGKDYEFTHATSAAPDSEREFASLSDSILIIPDNLIFIPSSGEFRAVCVSQQGSMQTAIDKFAYESHNSNLLNNASSWHLGKVTHNELTCRNVSYTGDNEFYYFSFDPVLKSGDMVTVKLDVKSDRVTDTEAYRLYCKKMAAGITLKIADAEKVSHNTAAGSMTETVRLMFEENAIDTGGYTDLVFEKITIERTIPELKKICSFNNRIWGITNRELCCSKLGDASEWNDFSTDSYGTLPYACFSTPASTEGDFTAIFSFGNYIYASKENAIHKLYGDNPDEFVLKTIETNGVAYGKSRTVAKCDTAVFYCTRNGIYRFDGARSERISYCLNEGIEFLCGQCDSDRYYALCTENGATYVYVYDIRRKIWHREDSEPDTNTFFRVGNEVYAATNTALIRLNCESEVHTPGNPEWNFTVMFDEKLFEKKGFGKISLRYSLGEDAFFTARAIYDDLSQGAVCGARHDEVFGGGGYMHMPVRRCRNFKIRFRGKGFFCLKSLRFQYYRGSDI